MRERFGIDYRAALFQRRRSRMNSGSRRLLSVQAGAVAFMAGAAATPVGAAGARAEHLPSRGAVAAGSARDCCSDR